MFLSESSRATYFPVQAYIGEHILGEDKFRNNPDSALPEEHVRALRRLGSLLRASLAEDMGIGRFTFDAGAEPIS